MSVLYRVFIEFLYTRLVVLMDKVLESNMQYVRAFWYIPPRLL